MATDPEVERLVAQFRDALEHVPAEDRPWIFTRIESLSAGLLTACLELAANRRPTTPEDTLREAGISSKRQAKYQRKMSSLLAGKA
jgi:hypothetical protein